LPSRPTLSLVAFAGLFIPGAVAGILGVERFALLSQPGDLFLEPRDFRLVGCGEAAIAGLRRSVMRRWQLSQNDDHDSATARIAQSGPPLPRATPVSVVSIGGLPREDQPIATSTARLQSCRESSTSTTAAIKKRLLLARSAALSVPMNGENRIGKTAP
jgi:hypothetical protein